MNKEAKMRELIALAKSIVAQDEFTCSEDSPLPIRQAYALINNWRRQAGIALDMKGESK